MSTLTRRLFMKCIPAAPVAAKEAAKKMGMEIGTRSVNGVGIPLGNCFTSSEVSTSRTDYIRKRLRDLVGDRDQARITDHAKLSARQIDPDIAAMRSISPSFAFVVQLERCQKRIEASERQSLLWELADCMEAGI